MKITLSNGNSYTLTDSQVELLRDKTVLCDKVGGVKYHEAGTFEPFPTFWKPEEQRRAYIKAVTDNHFKVRTNIRREGVTAHALVRKGLLTPRNSYVLSKRKVQRFRLTSDALSLRFRLTVDHYGPNYFVSPDF